MRLSQFACVEVIIVLKTVHTRCFTDFDWQLIPVVDNSTCEKMFPDVQSAFLGNKHSFRCTSCVERVSITCIHKQIRCFNVRETVQKFITFEHVATHSSPFESCEPADCEPFLVWFGPNSRYKLRCSTLNFFEKILVLL